MAKYGIDTSHWLGQGHLRGKNHSWTPRRPLSEILVENSRFADLTQLKRRLVAEGVLDYQCARCGIAEWLGRPLVLRLDHVNGVGDDHRLDNIRLLCPNCDSQTDTFCGKNTAKHRARLSAGSGSRTRTGFPPNEFESFAAAITPPRLKASEL